MAIYSSTRGDSRVSITGELEYWKAVKWSLQSRAMNWLYTSMDYMVSCVNKLSLLARYPEKNPPEKIPLNGVECEPVPTRVLNPNAIEASYKPKQRSYRKTKLIFFFSGILSDGFLPRTVIKNASSRPHFQELPLVRYNQRSFFLLSALESLSTYCSIFFCFCKHQLWLAKINHVIYQRITWNKSFRWVKVFIG